MLPGSTIHGSVEALGPSVIKFGQALAKLIAKLDSGNSKLLETEAIKEFRELHEKGHFPGLGYVKKLSMKHHIETLADYIG